MDFYYVYEKLIRILKNLTENYKKNIIIFSSGKIGKILKAILNTEFGIRELLYTDSVSDLDNEQFNRNEVIVLLALDYKLSETEKSNIRHEVLRHFTIDRVIDVLSPSVFFDPHMFDDDSYYTHPRKMFMESCSREIYFNGVSGSIAECGVYQGDSAVILNELFPERDLFLFDTFSGYDRKDMTKQEYTDWGDYMMFCHNRFKVVPSINDIYMRMPWRDNVHIIKGHFPDSVNEHDNIINIQFALVNLDMNLYNPMKEGLEFFWRHLSPGGILLVDDIRHKGMPSSRKALLEFCTKKKLAYSTINYDGMGMASIVKPL